MSTLGTVAAGCATSPKRPAFREQGGEWKKGASDWEREDERAGPATSSDPWAQPASTSRDPWTDAAPAGTRPPAKAPGCTHDVQCKGDRICVDGECIEPEPPEL